MLYDATLKSTPSPDRLPSKSAAKLSSMSSIRQPATRLLDDADAAALPDPAPHAPDPPLATEKPEAALKLGDSLRTLNEQGVVPMSHHGKCELERRRRGYSDMSVHLRAPQNQSRTYSDDNGTN